MHIDVFVSGIFVIWNGKSAGMRSKMPNLFLSPKLQDLTSIKEARKNIQKRKEQTYLVVYLVLLSTIAMSEIIIITLHLKDCFQQERV